MKLYLEVETDSCRDCPAFDYDYARCNVTGETPKKDNRIDVRFKKCPLKTKEELLRKWRIK